MNEKLALYLKEQMRLRQWKYTDFVKYSNGELTESHMRKLVKGKDKDGKAIDITLTKLTTIANALGISLFKLLKDSKIINESDFNPLFSLEKATCFLSYLENIFEQLSIDLPIDYSKLTDDQKIKLCDEIIMKVIEVSYKI